MNARWMLLAVVAASIAAASISVSVLEARAGSKQVSAYIALGDSVALGRGASDPSLGYVALVRHTLDRRGGPKHQTTLMNLAEPDTGIIELLSQLAPAVAELETRNGDSDKRNDVGVITVSAGAFDLFAVTMACMDYPPPACGGAARGILSFDSDLLNYALGELRAAGGPDTRILVMTYYNALVNAACDIHSLAPAWDALLEGDSVYGLENGLNDIIRSAANAQGAEVVDLFNRLKSSDLSADCLDPNDRGHAIIAHEFARVFTGKKPP